MLSRDSTSTSSKPGRLRISARRPLTPQWRTTNCPSSRCVPRWPRLGTVVVPEGNAVEVGENGDQIRPNRPEHHCEQRDHHQHGDAQRLLVDLLESDSWLFLRLGAFRPFLHQMLTARQRAAPRYAAPPRSGRAAPSGTAGSRSSPDTRSRSSVPPDAASCRSSRLPSAPSGPPER